MNGKSLSISTRIKTIEEKLAPPLTRITKERCMYKVHEQLRDVNKKAYKPVLLAIGPYYDQDEVGHGFMKEHKLRYLQQTLKGTKRSECIEALIGLEKDARECYAECIKQKPDDQFVEMMLLDGCFIIELFRKYKKRNEDDPIISSTDQQSHEYEAKDQTDAGDPIIRTKQAPKYEVQDLIDEADPIITTDEQTPEYEAQDPTDGGDPITGSEQSPEYDPIFQMAWVLPRIARDLLLFENQLPYFVLVKLFEIMSESNETRPRNGSRSSGEHIDGVEEKEEIGVESSTSADQNIWTRFNDLALSFFFELLPFKWDVDASSYNSPTTIKHLRRLITHEALPPSLPELVVWRLNFGLRFKKANRFEHLLGLIHASIGISILDTEIKRQAARVKCKKAEIFKHLFDRVRKAVILLVEKMENTTEKNSSANESQSEDWESNLFASELHDAGVEFKMTKILNDKIDEVGSWTAIDFDMELREAGIELRKAQDFNDRLARNRKENQKSKWCESGMQGDGVESKIAEKFKRLLCLNKIETWNSIPHGKELRDAGVKFNKAKKFKRLHALREIERWNIHCATELKEAGIKFKKAKEDDWFSINFNNGLMEISPMSIGDSTEAYLRNLLAYEQYCDQDEGFNYVNDYVHFMDGLINTPKDVELLRREGIIRNYLGDDAVISEMVNKLGDNINISTSKSIYARTSIDVNRYCRRRMHVWMAILRRDYFSSPWAWISFLAAVFLLGLAVVQTVFSIIP